MSRAADDVAAAFRPMMRTNRGQMLIRPHRNVAITWMALAIAMGAQAATAQELSPSWIAGGAFFASGNRSLHRPAEVVRELPSLGGNALSDDLMRQAQAVSQSPNRVTLLLVDKGRVVYRYLRSGVRSDSFIVSHSMAKSVTSLMVGHALCGGHIQDLGDRLDKYVPELSETVYGRASVRQLLNMSSGADASEAQGDPYAGFGSDLREQKVSYMEMLQTYRHPKVNPAGVLQPGQEFDYKSLDTAALSIVVEKATRRPLSQWFTETIVPAAGFARTTAWQVDKDRRPIAHGFLFATPDDWVRLALHALDAYKGRAGSCLKDYVQQAVSEGVTVTNNGEHKRYGRQFWTGTSGANPEVFWMRGYGGQYIGVDPRTERILVAASIKPEAGVMNLFTKWIQAE